MFNPLLIRNLLEKLNIYKITSFAVELLSNTYWGYRSRIPLGLQIIPFRPPKNEQAYQR